MPLLPRPVRRVVALCALGVPVAFAQRDTAARPAVLVIATGGTIAGVQDKPGTLGDYRAGTLTAQQILASVPTLTDYARVEAEQFANVPSSMITPRQWVALAKRINTVLSTRPELAGVVVTHGTDRLEETAFFLYLTVRSAKPVVVVGAQRPATSISADGPVNLLAAVRVAAAPQSAGHGVLVVMDDRIISAREARKFYPRVGGFAGGEMGMLGVVARAGPAFFFTPTRVHGPDSEFTLDGVDSLPSVDIAVSYPGGTGRTYEVLPAGVVVTGTALTCAESGAFQQLARRGVLVVTAFPSGEDVAGASGATAETVRTDGRRACPVLDSLGLYKDPWIPSISVQHLTPQKARILLMLALTRSRERAAVQRYFTRY
jgi:L-asparaginase type II